MMSAQNTSRQVITEFVFTGFDTVRNPLVVGVVMLILYILALITNTTNLYLIFMDKRLHQPMYLFICNLAIVDIISCTSACPTMVGILVVGHKSISYAPCIAQMFIFHLSGAMEMFTLSVMAFDRFIAISCPLRYHSILTNLRCVLITIGLWMAASAIVSMVPATVVPLQVCYSALKYMFCDYANIVRSTCVDPEPYFNKVSILTSVLCCGAFGFICLSYLKILIIIVRMSTKSDKKKAFNTCFSHLIVIICYYAPTFTRAVLTRIGVVLTMEERSGLLVGAILGPSLINPFVYCFRTKEIRNKLFQILSNVMSSEQRNDKGNRSCNYVFFCSIKHKSMEG